MDEDPCHRRMIRLGGTHLTAAILVGAEKTDESLGLIRTPGSDHDAEAMDESLPSGAMPTALKN